MKKTGIAFIKKMSICIAVLACVPSLIFAAGRNPVGYEGGFGSGFIFYGSQGVRSANRSFDASNQIILAADCAALFPLADSVFFAAGADSTFDFRWKGSDHLNRCDYAGTIGFRVYPGLAGLICSVDYALGRRTDFISLDDNDESIENTSWGNGFKFGLSYDFTGGKETYAPILGASWRHMPRGGYSDDMLVIFFKVSGK
jgi:hypothetical protein